MNVCVRRYACLYVCIYVCMYVCVYVCMYVCMYACMYVCMYVCMVVCMYRYLNFKVFPLIPYTLPPPSPPPSSLSMCKICTPQLASDSDPGVKNGSELLDRLIKDIVTESPTFDIDKFIPLLTERIYTVNPHARQVLASSFCCASTLLFVFYIYFSYFLSRPFLEHTHTHTLSLSLFLLIFLSSLSLSLSLSLLPLSPIAPAPSYGQ